jgi:lipopolysaccharide/colanic/teichoic acid biosynthesis glycosyltransferase
MHTTFLSFLRSIIDIAIICFCWIIVYFLRFYSGLFVSTKGIPSFKNHLLLLIPVVCICYIGCLWGGLYKPKRIQNILKQFIEVLKATLLGWMLLLAFFYYIKDVPYSRKLLTVFVFMLLLGFFFSHLLIMSILRFFRKRGYNLRYYAVIGAGRKGIQLVEDIQQMNWTGLKCAFFIDNDPEVIGTQILGTDVYGPIEKIIDLVKSNRVDEVYLTLDGGEALKMFPYLESLQSAGITIRIIPDWGNLISINQPVVFSIGSQILFSAADSPLSGHMVILKQIFDTLIATLLIILFSFPMIIIALLIKLTSKGPVFYKQVRMGLDQKEFEIIKFRTMITNAEEKNGPQWSIQNDNRCTSVGRWLRRTSLDELPQLINVLKGDLSLVGPRPERPCFVKQFSEEYRRYMLRHKVKAGITGWAQVNGFRGNTSLRKRLIYDLYYVKNWSFAFDIGILLLTPWQVIRGENAH